MVLTLKFRNHVTKEKCFPLPSQIRSVPTISKGDLLLSVKYLWIFWGVKKQKTNKNPDKTKELSTEDARRRLDAPTMTEVQEQHFPVEEIHIFTI